MRIPNPKAMQLALIGNDEKEPVARRMAALANLADIPREDLFIDVPDEFSTRSLRLNMSGVTAREC